MTPKINMHHNFTDFRFLGHFSVIFELSNSHMEHVASDNNSQMSFLNVKKRLELTLELFLNISGGE